MSIQNYNPNRPKFFYVPPKVNATPTGATPKSVKVVIGGQVETDDSGKYHVSSHGIECYGVECSDGVVVPAIPPALSYSGSVSLLERLVAAYRAGEPMSALLDEYDASRSTEAALDEINRYFAP